MPNVITHGLMAQDVVNVLDDNKISKVIEKYPQLFFVGSNGPDFLFYYRFLSHDDNAKHLRNIGNIFHCSHINDFYHAAIKYLQTLQGDDYDRFLSYLSGHLCHWALDSLAHPYIFHKTGLIQGESRYHHFRMESMIDNLMVTQIKKGKLKDFPTYKFCTLSSHDRLVIAKGYQDITFNVLSDLVPLKEFNEALQSMQRYTKILFDPSGIKFKAVQWIERHILKDEWFLSSHFVSKFSDLKRDVLNLKKQSWTHPSCESDRADFSLVELYQLSVYRAKEALSYLLNNDVVGLIRYLDNRDYETGYNSQKEMKYFNLLY